MTDVCAGRVRPCLESAAQRWSPSVQESCDIETPATKEASGQEVVCCVCLQAHAASDSVGLLACRQEAHRTCLGCMSTHLRLRIQEGRVGELVCPGSRAASADQACVAQASEAELVEWLDPDLVEKYHRFSAMRQDPSLRSCPFCDKLCETRGAELVTCEACNLRFCFYHSNAHEPTAEACAEYTRWLAQQELLWGMPPHMRQCPQCGIPTEKSSGCNHMTCPCGCDWCWLCRKSLENPGWHYNPLNPASCLQFHSPSESASEVSGCQAAASKVLMYLCKAISLPIVLVAILGYVVFLLVLSVLSPFLLCCGCSDRGVVVWIGFSTLIVGLPFGIVAMAWSIVGCAIWLLLCPFGAGEPHMQLLGAAPFLTWFALIEGLLGRLQDSSQETGGIGGSPRSEPEAEPTAGMVSSRDSSGASTTVSNAAAAGGGGGGSTPSATVMRAGPVEAKATASAFAASTTSTSLTSNGTGSSNHVDFDV